MSVAVTNLKTVQIFMWSEKGQSLNPSFVWKMGCRPQVSWSKSDFVTQYWENSLFALEIWGLFFMKLTDPAEVINKLSIQLQFSTHHLLFKFVLVLLKKSEQFLAFLLWIRVVCEGNWA